MTTLGSDDLGLTKAISGCISELATDMFKINPEDL